MNRVVHFEIPASDMDAAIRFYRDVFGWRIEKWEGPMDYWLVYTGEEGEAGIDGALTAKDETSDRVVNTVDVDDIDETVRKVESAGGTVVSGKTAVPGVGWMAYAVDPDGNAFGVMQEDPAAGAG